MPETQDQLNENEKTYKSGDEAEPTARDEAEDQAVDDKQLTEGARDADEVQSAQAGDADYIDTEEVPQKEADNVELSGTKRDDAKTPPDNREEREEATESDYMAEFLARPMPEWAKEDEDDSVYAEPMALGPQPELDAAMDKAIAEEQPDQTAQVEKEPEEMAPAAAAAAAQEGEEYGIPAAVGKRSNAVVNGVNANAIRHRDEAGARFEKTTQNSIVNGVNADTIRDRDEAGARFEKTMQSTITEGVSEGATAHHDAALLKMFGGDKEAAQQSIYDSATKREKAEAMVEAGDVYGIKEVEWPGTEAKEDVAAPKESAPAQDDGAYSKKDKAAMDRGADASAAEFAAMNAKAASKMQPAAEKSSDAAPGDKYTSADGAVDKAAGTARGPGGKTQGGTNGSGTNEVVNTLGNEMKLTGTAELNINGMPAGELTLNLEGTGGM